MTIVDVYKIVPNWKSLVKSQLSMFNNYPKDLSEFSVELHNATWCPDCERESSALFAMVESLGGKAPKLKIIGYENIQEYKQLKTSKKLEISCLPTIIFKNSNQEAVLSINEKSNPSFREVINIL